MAARKRKKPEKTGNRKGVKRYDTGQRKGIAGRPDLQEQARGGSSGGNGQGITIVQHIHATPQTPVQLAAATQAAFEQARWTL